MINIIKLNKVKKQTYLIQLISVRYQLLILCILFFLLNACVQITPKQSQPDVVKVQEKSSQIDVNSDVKRKFNQAVALMQQNKSKSNTLQAISLFKSVTEREKRLPAPYVDLAIAYERINNTRLAEENLISALKLEIGNAVANNELGLLYRKAGRFKAARVAYQNAINAHPDYLPAKRNLGVLCDIYIHDYACALAQFQDYLELKPDDKIVAIWVADLKQRMSK